jgi:hypothetical protein
MKSDLHRLFYRPLGGKGGGKDVGKLDEASAKAKTLLG